MFSLDGRDFPADCIDDRRSAFWPLGLDDLGAPKCWETSKYDPNGNID